jgi:diacylglycerol kinase (CTP)
MVGRLFGSYTQHLPRRLPILRLPLAPRKSVAGSVAASLTGACVAVAFWKHIAPFRSTDLSWKWDTGIQSVTFSGSDWLRSHLSTVSFEGVRTGGWVGLAAIAIVAGLVTGIAEALGKRNFLHQMADFLIILADLSLDDNLTLPVISGGCLLVFFRLTGLFSS